MYCFATKCYQGLVFATHRPKYVSLVILCKIVLGMDMRSWMDLLIEEVVLMGDQEEGVLKGVRSVQEEDPLQIQGVQEGLLNHT